MTRVIAEISGNHGGDLGRCLELIRAAKESGCWAVKFQLYAADDLPDFNSVVNFPIPVEWLPPMFEAAGRLILFASAFHPWAVKELRDYTRYFKIASPESTRLSEERYRSLFAHMPYGSKVFVSSGRADWDWMRKLFPASKRGGTRGGQMLYCKSVYPATISEMLYCKSGYPATITDDDIIFMARNAVGFSDHTAGIMAPLAMAGAGAKYIEKHFKLDDDCVDAAFSLNPVEMKTLCDLCS